MRPESEPSRSRAGRPASGGFSLVELLVVLAVIGLLAAMLLPTMNMVRAVARQMVCATNLRQLQMANLGYANDWDGNFVPQFKYTAATGMTYWWPTNPDLIRNFTNGQTTDRAQVSKKLLCPLSRRPGDVIPGSTTPQFEVSFAMNDGKYYTWPPPVTFYGYDNATMKRPGEKIAFMDALGFDLVYSQANPASYFVGGVALPEGVSAGCVAYRHRGRANVAWYDGHVSASQSKVVYDWLVWDPRF